MSEMRHAAHPDQVLGLKADCDVKKAVGTHT